MYSLSTNPGHKPFYVYVYLYLYLCLDRIRHQQQDYRKQFHPFLSICPLPHITCWPSVCPSCLSVCAGTKRSRSGSVCSFNKCFFFYFMQIITLIMLLSTSFASCLSDKTHQCGLSKAEYTRLWYPVQFPIDRRCFEPESWHTLFWWLFGSFLVFSMPRSACANTISAVWLLLRFSFSVWCWYKCCWNSNCKSKYRSTVFAYFTCTYMSCLPALKQEGQSASPNLSICLGSLSVFVSLHLCFSYICLWCWYLA